MEGHNGNNDLYKECLRNHAASLGSYATDGCGEFTTDDEGRLQCAACGCHRNFHRKVSYCGSSRGGEVERSGGGGGASSSKKRMRTKFTAEQKEKMLGFAEKLGWKLMRMRDEEEDDEVEKFCRGIGVTRQVFKVWMHNHKTTSTSINSHYSSAANASSLTTDL